MVDPVFVSAITGAGLKHLLDARWPFSLPFIALIHFLSQFLPLLLVVWNLIWEDFVSPQRHSLMLPSV